MLISNLVTCKVRRVVSQESVKAAEDNCTAKDDAKLKDKGKGKAIDEVLKFWQQGKFF